MIEQQKAEAYVREKLPELKRLVSVVQQSENVKELTYEYDDDIQLQHWLRVLFQSQEGIRFNWSVGELYLRVGNTRAMTFNLTIGSPATEEDYKAFNDITNPKE